MQRLTSSSASFVVLTREFRWHAGLPYGYPHLSSTRGKRARWRAETNIVSCTFCRPDPWSQVTCRVTFRLPTPFVNQGQTSPLTRRDKHRLLHLFSSWPVKSGDIRGYLMVTRTFRQPGANEPVDAQRLTSSFSPFFVLTREVRWHAGLPYGYPHLSSTRGKRARWQAETNIVFCTFCRLDPWSQVTCGVTVWLPAPFVNQGQTSPLTHRD